MPNLADMPWIAFLAASFVVPTEMLAASSPQRAHFAERATICLTGLLVVLLLLHSRLMHIDAPTVFDLTTYWGSILSFGLTIVVIVASLMTCHELSLSAATFCATAGYTIQNMGQTVADLLAELTPLSKSISGLPSAADVLGAVIVCLASYVFLASKVRAEGLTRVDEKKMLAMAPLVIFVNIVAALPFRDLLPLGLPLQGMVILRTLHLVTCSLMLTVEFEFLVSRQLRVKQLTAERALEERRRQYALSKDTIEAINVKCHDIRHQIRTIGDGLGSIPQSALQEIAREVNIYDSAVSTGNEALDTILTEKSLVCEQDSIVLSCIADGHLLDEMAASDIYALFGNALDNAIEAEKRVEAEEARSISVVIHDVAGMASIHIENYCTETLEFREGLPVTTKADSRNHGFGTRSMRLIVSRYEGTIVMGREQDCFFVNILIPR